MSANPEAATSDSLDQNWVFEKDFDVVASLIKDFECAEVVLEIKPIRIRPDAILFGLYIPHMPRLTNILSGKILIRRLSGQRTELQVMDLAEWAAPFINSLINEIKKGG
jgi:hypothetical protein